MSEGSRNSSPNIHHQLQLHHLSSTPAISPVISTMSGVSSSKASKHQGLAGNTPPLHHSSTLDLEARSDEAVPGSKQQHQAAHYHPEHLPAHSWHHHHQSGGSGQNVSPTKPLPKHRRYSQPSQGRCCTGMPSAQCWLQGMHVIICTWHSILIFSPNVSTGGTMCGPRPLLYVGLIVDYTCYFIYLDFVIFLLHLDFRITKARL